MKNTFKRIAAFAITLCMLLSVVPAVAFAEEIETPAQLDTITYDFYQKAPEFTYMGGTGNTTPTTVPLAGVNLAEVSNKGVGGRAKVAELYDAGTINWKYLSTGHLTDATDQFSFGIGADSVNYAFLLRVGASSAQIAGGYFAMTIKSPGTGDYALSLDYFTHTTGAAKGSVYVLPASVTDIPGALDYYAPVGSFSCESSNSNGTTLTAESVTFSNAVSMKAGKEYILVFTSDELSSRNNKRAALYLGNVTLDLQEQTPVLDLDTITYDFGQGRRGDTYDGTATGTSFSGIDVHNSSACKSALSTKYANGDLQWKYHSSGMYIDSTNTTFSFGYAKTTVNYNLLLRAGASSAQIAGGYFATTIRSPGTGDYAVTLDYFTHTTGAAQGSVYVLPGDTTDIAAAINAGTAVGTFSCESSNSNGTTLAAENKTFDNAVTMEAGEEYLLVFTSDALSSQNNKRAALYLGNVTLNKIVSLDEIEYDFDLRNEEYTYAEGDNRKFAGLNITPKTGTAPFEARKVMNALYANGDINWNYHSVGNTADGTATAYSFSFGAANVNYSLLLAASNLPGSYFATTIKSPGYGNYEMTVDYFTHSTGASQVGVYILPADTADIAAAIAAGTAVGTFSCEGAFTSGTVLGEGTATYDVALGMDDEYLLVFTNDKVSSTNAARASAYLGGVKLTNKAAGGSEEVSGDFIADGKSFATFEEAVAAAYDADDLAVKLNADVAMDELIVPANLSIDLNGKTLTVDALSGSVTDSSAGNTGLLAAERDTIVFSAKNADAPLWDAAAGGYRFFDYLLEVFDEAEAVEGKPSSQKFWFKFHFYTDDACTELDQDAYALVAGGNSGFKVATHMSWNGEALPSVYYGIDDDVDAFSRGWATNATASRWLYIRVDGLDEDLYGTLRVKPELEANGVYISNTVVSYVNEAPDTAE